MWQRRFWLGHRAHLLSPPNPAGCWNVGTFLRLLDSLRACPYLGKTRMKHHSNADLGSLAHRREDNLSDNRRESHKRVACSGS